ncbi:MAG: kynureninase [Bacteroidetes bacterium]|nr:kynureninase [Bacteroidota bacterium]
MQFENSLEYAQKLDEQDQIKSYRNLFHLPKRDGRELIYFCGNSLGLQPKSVESHIKAELKDWAELGVEGHLHGEIPWYYCHHLFAKSIVKLIGGKENEVVVMNQLSVNLNLLLISFYRPNGKRNKILIQANEFPSDYYAIEQQIKLHGLNPEECIIEVRPRNGETILHTDDILAKIEEHSDELALIMFSAVNYYTGQFFELEKISKIATKHQVPFGVDLAHAIGNVELKLHDWSIDFATWCSYKYLNSGPGGVSGIFVHQKHGQDFSLPRLAGWWGNEEKTRFTMPKNFIPQAGAAGWQISNAPVLSMAAHRASLEIFDKVGLSALRKKSALLTGYLEYLINNQESSMTDNKNFQIITPRNTAERGCQLSIQTKENGKKLFQQLSREGIVADWREPDVIRVAPVPLYNTFEEVYRFAHLLKQLST